MKIVLSESSKLKRRRMNKVNLQMTVMSWSLEFIAGLVCLGVNFNPESSPDLISIMVIFDACLSFIIIPSTYIFNDEVRKRGIIAEGWYIGVRGHMDSNSVGPAPNNDSMKMKPSRRQQQILIPTISGDICNKNVRHNLKLSKSRLRLKNNGSKELLG